MTIRYPNGHAYRAPAKKIESPFSSANTNYGKRGMTLEEELNESNTYYEVNGVAVVHKKPTPIRIVKVDYPKRSAAVIKEAYFSTASTTDYNGVYQGHYLDFDAKETRNTTSFPLQNFHQHQIDHMRACTTQGGICFAIIKFVTRQEIYLYRAQDLFTFWDAQQQGGRKSIPYATIAQDGIQIPAELQLPVPYLKAVDQLLS
ncbi:Holliday junction resolvase RecU [Levilactobacillus brevis]|uniref:Holliday junction resolvase RecU n=1 Tax=Levilactobacillus brevis TaxID=1580 RepID=UPI000BEA715A|nr:Holliday junction resolvase RecU [Levilactobacillus brevis]MCP9614456.1 Holliday junction resolvase RecU [Levilactobacillus brevis]MCT3584098.1 Holliday junction resolvase RecU [Levilactobacillus brevis]MCZ2119178.1 Holliday junction resolvase RecU [Levilactobacillus brevis]MCZ2124682.1 Holliday junction resolvase RecU [Levilactobacillus brevis]MCZ2209001.1 Holliday junction resolvase RecU [Levilactobacillus brevis]